MKTNPTPNYDYHALTAPLPFVVESQDVLKSNTSIRRKKTNTGNTKLTEKAANSRTQGNIEVPSLIVKTYKLPLYLVRQVESVAYWQRRKIQDVMADAMTLYLDTIPAEDRRPIPGQ